MSRTTIEKRPLVEKERFFVNLYLGANCDPSSVPACEKRAHLKAGSGLKILRRKKVKDEIQLKTEVARQEQARSDLLSEAVAKAEALLQQRLAEKVQRKKIDLEVLDHELMCGIEGLDWNRFPKEKLEAIKAGYVVFGTLESGNTRRLIPPEHLQQNDGQGTYTALFNRLALKPQESAAEAPTVEPGVFDLIPGAGPSLAESGPLPPPGEPIQQAPQAVESDPNVITVEVG